MKPTRCAFASACVLALLASGAWAQTEAPGVEHPPIPIAFRLKEAGFVTLAIDDAAGLRVRNLIAETPFPAGNSVVYWDGLDDRGRDTDAASHGVYHVPGKFVAPGRYTVRGLFRKAIDLRYEFAVYNPGRPPWRTASTRSQWLTCHTPPGTLCFIPAGAAPEREGAGAPAQMLIGSYVAEGGSGLAWIDLDGNKLHGQMWVGGVWTGAEMLTRDLGPEPAAGVYAYVASSWKGDNNNQAEIRLHRLVNDAQKLPAPRDTRMGSGEDPPVLTPTWKFPEAQKVGLGGLAAWNGLVVASLTKMDALLFVDAPRSNVLGTVALAAPRGLAFDRQGRLLAVSSNRIVRLALPPKAQCRDQMALPAPEVLVTDGLEEPQQLALDQAGALLYVSDRGKCNQVKVFAIAEPPARLVRAIGSAGVAKAGPYDPLQMHKPKGIALDDRGRLWVAEDDHQPKRVSVWSADGQLVKAYYGPPQYGGGGVLDPEDKTLFYHNGMTFALDWTAGQSHLMALRWRPGRRDFDIAHEHNSGGPPDTPVYFKGRKYYTDCFVGNPTGGSQVFNLWRDRGGVAVPAASFGKAGAWQWLTNDVFLAMIPADTKRKRDASKPARGGLGQGIPAPALRWEATAGKEAGTPTPESKAPATVGVPPSGGPHPVTDPLPKPPDLDGVVYAWSDLNGDGVGQPEEVQFARTDAGMVQYMRTPSHRQTAQPEASPHLFSPYSWVGRTLWVSRPQSGRVTPS